MNFEQARFNMVEQQVRPWEVLDPRVLDVLATVPREAFVPQRYRALAFGDLRIPLGRGQTMMRPIEEGRMLQSLTLDGDESVLEIGTGSGFITACLARLGATVTSIEIFDDFRSQAASALAEQEIDNIRLLGGDASSGWPESGHFDAIAITGSLPELSDSFRKLLTTGGRLFAITGDSPAMTARLVTRVGEQQWAEETLFETDLPPLVHAVRPPRFAF